MKRTPWSRLAIALLVLALAATACRSSGTDTADDDDTATTAPDTTATDAATDAGAGGEIATDVGVTEEPCPDAVNEDNGCIYLGVLSDFTEGPFSAAGPVIQEAQEAFFRRVNEAGGIEGYDVDITTHVKDNLYTPETQVQVFEEIRNEVLAIGLSLGSSPTLAIKEDVAADNIVTVPGAWNSDFAFEEIIAESGANYCFEAMNAVDYFVENSGGGEKVMGIHYPNDYGQDGSTGARLAAEANDMEFISVPTPPGPENQGEAVQQILSEEPDLVFLTVAPAETAAIVGGAAAQGFEGQFIGQSPTWNVALLGTDAGEALKALYLQAAPWATFDTDTPGHQAMRDTLGDVQASDFYTAGWVWSYPILRTLEAAAANGDLTRQGVADAYNSLTSVDYEGMLPEGAGNYAAEPAERAVRASLIAQPDEESGAGVSVIEDFFVGPTAEAHDFSEPCINQYEG